MDCFMVSGWVADNIELDGASRLYKHYEQYSCLLYS